MLCRGVRAELEKLSADDDNGKCTVLFRTQGVEARVDYDHVRGKGKGSARLKRPLPSLRPDPRATRRDAVSTEVTEHVREVYESSCPSSPCVRDLMKRRLAPHVMQVPSRARSTSTTLHLHNYRRDIARCCSCRCCDCYYNCCCCVYNIVHSITA